MSANDLRDGGVIYTGHEVCLKRARKLFEGFGLPNGLFPAAEGSEILELGFVKNTGFFWIMQTKGFVHKFKMVERAFRFGSEISGFMEMGRISKVVGIQSKEFFIWSPITQITLQGDDVVCKNFAGLLKIFPSIAFAAGA